MAIVPNNSENVAVGKGKFGAYILSAPAGTPLPTDATTALDDAFVNTGYVNNEGITKSVEKETDDKKDLNGDTIYTAETSRTETYHLVWVETRIETLKEYYGQSNVTVDEQGHVRARSNSAELPIRSYVIETVLSGNRPQRIVISKGKITELGDEVYSSGELIGYEATITAYPDENGDCSNKYIDSLPINFKKIKQTK